MKAETDDQLEAVPEVVLEAFIQQEAGYRMTRVRVEGRRHELDDLLREFNQRVTYARYSNYFF